MLFYFLFKPFLLKPELILSILVLHRPTSGEPRKPTPSHLQEGKQELWPNMCKPEYGQVKWFCGHVKGTTHRLKPANGCGGCGRSMATISRSPSSFSWTEQLYVPCPACARSGASATHARRRTPGQPLRAPPPLRRSDAATSRGWRT